MTALTADRTDVKIKDRAELRDHPVAAAVVLYKNALVCKVGGYLAPALNTSGYSNVIGIANEKRDNSAGAAGAISAPVRSGISINVAVTGGTQAFEQNTLVYVADDQTVSTVVNSGVKAGYVEKVVSSTVLRIFIPLGGTV